MEKVLTAISMIFVLILTCLSALRYVQGDTLRAIYLLLGSGFCLINWGLVQIRNAIREAR